MSLGNLLLLGYLPGALFAVREERWSSIDYIVLWHDAEHGDGDSAGIAFGRLVVPKK